LVQSRWTAEVELRQAGVEVMLPDLTETDSVLAALDAPRR